MSDARRLVVAEDDPTLLEMLVRVLETAGYDVSAHRDGRSAVQAAAAQVPDAFILDVSMPVMTGLEATQELRSQASTAGVPIMLLTAHGQWVDVAGGFDSGADDYVTKPFSPQDLLQRLSTLLVV